MHSYTSAFVVISLFIIVVWLWCLFSPKKEKFFGFGSADVYGQGTEDINYGLVSNGLLYNMLRDMNVTNLNGECEPCQSPPPSFTQPKSTSGCGI